MGEYSIVHEGGRGVERHSRLGGALQAYWVLVAHELKNGREPKYELRGPDDEVMTAPLLLEAELYSWQIPVLKERGLIAEKETTDGY
jgi:hypothetical protein